MENFVHLHVHSEYSLLDGACRTSDIPKTIKSMGQSAVAITDHGVMYGVVEFYKACQREGIKPIIGCEVYVAPDSRFERVQKREHAYYHLVLLVENEIGYQNLAELVSLGFTEGFYVKPRVDLELLKKKHEGLIALSGCIGGMIPQDILAGDLEQAEAHAKALSEIFGKDHFYLEVQNHGLEEEKLVNNALFVLAKKLDLPLVATNDAHYVSKKDAEAQAVLMCIQTNSVITEGRPMGFETDEFYLKSGDEMAALFQKYPEAIENTVKIADRCRFDFEFSVTHLPKYEPVDGSSSKDFLRRLSYSGFAEKISENRIVFTEQHTEALYKERIEYELRVIEQMGYSQYFLIVWDFVAYAKSVKIPVGPGRGSGAGSLVAYLIGITDVDSIKHDLLFERFLNPERVSMPDFDIDFCDERRDEVIDYVSQRYGSSHVAQIITFGTLAARAVVRDVGRALDMPYSEVDEIAKMIPRSLGMTLEKALAEKELKYAYENNPKVKRLIDLGMSLEGMPRHASVHAAGVVITDKPVTAYVPVTKSENRLITQFDMNTVAELGVLKFDFLALRYLTIISEAEKQVREVVPEFDITKIPLDDVAVYAMISAGKTDGVFQLESGGMRQMLTQFKPEHFNDIIAAIALYRPGPMDSIPNYIECRHGRKKPEYVSPLLAPILDSTYGCIVYQEQVMQIFRLIADYSLGRADIVRRAISKKKRDVLENEKNAFVEGASRHGISESDAKKLFDEIVAFANYAFNKCHATPYALISYRTAYLKCHYPKEYHCALLTSVLGNTGKISEYIGECSGHGIAVLPPDINKSFVAFHPEGSSIRFSLLGLKNVGRTFVETLEKERREKGPFLSLENFLDRIDSKEMNKKQFESLIKSGSLDCLGVKRSQLLAVYESLLENKATTGRASLDGQMDLFALVPSAASVTPKFSYPDIPELSSREKMRYEKESSGLFLSGHLLDDYTEHIELCHPAAIHDIKASFLETEAEGEEVLSEADGRYRDHEIVTICGVITGKTNKVTKRGDPMAFVSLEDKSGEIEVVVFAKKLEEFAYQLRLDCVIAVSGEISVKEDQVSILLRDVFPLYENKKIPEDVKQALARKESGQTPEKRRENIKQPSVPTTQKPARLYLKVPSIDSEAYRRALHTVEIFCGEIPVVIYDASSGKKYMSESLKAASTEFLLRELQDILGTDAVVLK